MEIEKQILEAGLGVTEISEEVSEAEFQSDLELYAYRVACEAHKGQFRKEKNKEYITHLVAVWRILRYLGIDDPEIFAAGLLHDIVEDTKISEGVIVERFGERVYRLIEGVTELKNTDKNEAEISTRERTLRQSGLDYGVSAIKMADRIHNIVTQGVMPPEKRMAKGRHTLEFVVNLAMVYKMWDAAIMLSDLSFPYAYPVVWEREAPIIAADPRLRPGFWRNRQEDMGKIFGNSGVVGEAKCVFGGFYRCYQSLLRKGSEYSDVNDLMSVEVVVGNDADCYVMMGQLHSFYEKMMVPNDIRDYLTVPTFDGYSALQTTINFPGFGLVKYVITTRERSDFNHRGVLALPKKDRKHYRAKLVRDSEGSMVVLPEKGTVLDAAIALYSSKVGNAIGFYVNGKVADPSDLIEHAGVLTLVTMGRPSWGRFDGVVCSSATRHIIDDERSDEIRRLRSNHGKEKMDMYLRAAGMGLLELEDLAFINDETREFLDQIVTRVAGGRGSLADFYFILSREYGAEPEEVVGWLRNFGLNKEKYGLATVLLEVKDEPGVLYQLTELLGQLGKDVNINHIIQSEKTGQREVVVLRFVLTGLKVNQEQAMRLSLEAKRNIFKVVVV